MKNETLGDRIRLRRKSLQLTQKQLAQQVKVSHVAISQWEKEETLPRGENLLRLAEALGCAQAVLIDGDGPVFSESAWSGLHQIPLLAQRDVPQWLNEAGSVRHELLMHNDMPTHLLWPTAPEVCKERREGHRWGRSCPAWLPALQQALSSELDGLGATVPPP